MHSCTNGMRRGVSSGYERGKKNTVFKMLFDCKCKVFAKSAIGAPRGKQRASLTGMDD